MQFWKYPHRKQPNQTKVHPLFPSRITFGRNWQEQNFWYRKSQKSGQLSFQGFQNQGLGRGCRPLGGSKSHAEFLEIPLAIRKKFCKISQHPPPRSCAKSSRMCHTHVGIISYAVLAHTHEKSLQIFTALIATSVVLSVTQTRQTLRFRSLMLLPIT